MKLTTGHTKHLSYGESRNYKTNPDNEIRAIKTEANDRIEDLEY
jgi:hypothetical protein